MNVRLLIDSIVRETTVLIAQLATSGGLRAPLAHVAGQVFLDLAKQLESQGVPKKVTADMFGLALRTYQRRTQRLTQSRTDRGRSLWEAVFDFIRKGDLVTREDIWKRFRNDDEASLRGVLHDLTESGLVFVSGAGRRAAYRAASDEELGKVRRDADAEGLDAFVWGLVYRDGPIAAEQLLERSRLEQATMDRSLSSLLASGRIERVESADGVHYRSRELVLRSDDPAGWEASVLDHFAMVARTITRKLMADLPAGRSDEVGGSTYHFVIWRGHPHEDEVLGELRRFRERMSALRERIDRYNAEKGLPTRTMRVDAYYGQSATEDEDELDDPEGTENG
jgi:hypothetical protein